MQITGMFTPSGKFYPVDEPVAVQEENEQLVDVRGIVRAVKDGGEWISFVLQQCGVRSKVQVVL